MGAEQAANSNIDMQQIDRLRDRHVAAVNAGEVEAWLACFTDDGIQLPPHFGANIGKMAVRGWSQGFLDLFACRFSLSVDEVRTTADWAFERGRYTMHASPKNGGEPLDDSGKYITIYERQSDGSWKIARDIWNSDLPLPGAR